MRIRALLISSSVAACAALGAGGASAATLYTDSLHGTQVAVGATAGATNTTAVVLTSATSVLNTCNASTLGLTVTANSGGTVTANILSGSFSSCSPLPATGTFATPWVLEVSGSPTTVGGVTTWPASVTLVSFDLAGGLYHGSLTTGVTAQQTGSGGAVCLDFNDSGTLTGPLTSNGRIDARYCFEGTAHSFSLT